MRKVDIEMTKCVSEARSATLGNTTIITREFTDGGKQVTSIVVMLHGNRIGWFHREKDVGITKWGLSTCGYDTNVTVARLNALLQRVCNHPLASFHIVDGTTHLFWEKYDLGEVYEIDNLAFAVRYDLLMAKLRSSKR